jgi:hypothetical protein
VWVLTSPFSKPIPGYRPGVDRFDQDTLAKQAHVDFPPACEGAGSIAASGGFVWVNGTTDVCGIDPARNEVVRMVSVSKVAAINPSAVALDATADRVLVGLDTSRNAHLAGIDPRSGEVTGSVDLGVQGSSTVAAVADSEALVGVEQSGSPSVLLRVRDQTVLWRVNVDAASLVAAEPDGSGWIAAPFGNVVRSVGPDGRIRGSLRGLHDVLGLVSGGDVVYFLTDSTVLVATFRTG